MRKIYREACLIYFATLNDSTSVRGENDETKKRTSPKRRADALATTCGARMRDGSRAPCLLRLCASRFAHRTCTLYVLSSSSSSSAARHRTLEDSRDRHDLNQPEIHRVPRIREFYPTTFPNEYDKKKERNKERKKHHRWRPRIPISISTKKKKKKKKPKRNESKPPKRRFEGIG